jgi:hypothetical protein
MLFYFSSAIACASEIPIKQGMPFLAARSISLLHDWKPSGAKEMQPVGTALELENIGIVEIERCTQGVQYCEFHYKKDNECPSITTTGAAPAGRRVDR